MSSFFLTIDDAPSSHTGNKLRTLDKLGIKAIWFCQGNNLEKHQEIAVKIICSGHIIGNHSYSHPFFSETSFDDCRDEIVTTEDIIDGIYDKARVLRLAKFFRFPYGEPGHYANGKPSDEPEKIFHRNRLQKLLRELGFQSNVFLSADSSGKYMQGVDWMWSYDVREWAIDRLGEYGSSLEEVEKDLVAYLRSYNRNKNQIVLMHDSEKCTKHFDHLLNIFIEAGVSFKLPTFEA